MLTKHEVMEWFEANTSACEEFMNEDLWETKYDVKEAFEGWEYESVDHYGGEDQGSTYYTVWKFSNGEEEFFLRFDGYYQSHYGTAYETFNEVKPKKVEQIVWN